MSATTKTKMARSVRQVSHDSLQCRAFDHAWKWVTDTEFERAARNGTRGKILSFERVRECQVCGSEQRITIDTIDWKRRSYVAYADYYLMVGRRLLKADARKELVRRHSRASKKDR